MIAPFHDMMHKEMGVYLDDKIAKSMIEEAHPVKKIFEQLRNYDLKLNPSKYVLGATFGKLLGFIVTEHGIEINPSKI